MEDMMNETNQIGLKKKMTANLQLGQGNMNYKLKSLLFNFIHAKCQHSKKYSIVFIVSSFY